jgi:predicted Kef-type K+ transport protein
MLRVLAFALVAGILVAFLLGAPDRLRARDLVGYLVALTYLVFGAVTYLAIAYLFSHR